jgi:transcriptional regulator with XRE-family HTH domain
MAKNINLKIAIFRKGITQQELSKQTGIPRAYISQAIHGRYVFEAEEWRKIAKELGVTMEEIRPANI